VGAVVGGVGWVKGGGRGGYMRRGGDEGGDDGDGNGKGSREEGRKRK